MRSCYGLEESHHPELYGVAGLHASLYYQRMHYFYSLRNTPRMGAILNRSSVSYKAVLGSNSFSHFYYSTASIFYSISASGYQEVIDLIPFHVKKKKKLTH